MPMGMSIRVNVPENLYRHLQRLADASGRSVGEVANSMMSVSLLPLSVPASDVPVEQLSDEEVLELAASHMNPAQNARMNELLIKQQAEALNELEDDELSVLVYISEEGSILKTRAWSEAVRRGLRILPVN